MGFFPEYSTQNIIIMKLITLGNSVRLRCQQRTIISWFPSCSTGYISRIYSKNTTVRTILQVVSCLISLVLMYSYHMRENMTSDLSYLADTRFVISAECDTNWSSMTIWHMWLPLINLAYSAEHPLCTARSKLRAHSTERVNGYMSYSTPPRGITNNGG